MHWLHRPTIVLRTRVISSRLILDPLERFSGDFREWNTGATSFGLGEKRKFLRVETHPKREQRKDATNN
jgi:hypothetical protein